MNYSNYYDLLTRISFHENRFAHSKYIKLSVSNCYVILYNPISGFSNKTPFFLRHFPLSFVETKIACSTIQARFRCQFSFVKSKINSGQSREMAQLLRLKLFIYKYIALYMKVYRRILV